MTGAICAPRSRAGELGNADFGLHYIGLSGTDVTDKVYWLLGGRRAGLRYRAFKILQFGAASTMRKKERNTVENDTNGGSCQYCNLYDTTFESLGADVVRHLSLPNFMRNGGGQLSAGVRLVRCRRSISTRCARWMAQPILDENGDPTGELHDASLTAARFNPVQSYDVKEETDRAVSERQLRRRQLVRECRRALDHHRHHGEDRDRQHRVRGRPDAGRADVQPGRHLQPRRAAQGEGQLQQVPAFVERRLLAAQGSAAARRGGAG